MHTFIIIEANTGGVGGGQVNNEGEFDGDGRGGNATEMLLIFGVRNQPQLPRSSQSPGSQSTAGSYKR